MIMKNIDIEKKVTSASDEKTVNYNRGKMNVDILKLCGTLVVAAGHVIKIIKDKRIQFIVFAKEDNMPNKLTK